MKKEEFLKSINDAIMRGTSFYVFVKAPGMPENEAIINPHANLRQKKEYYMNAYDDDMKLKVNNEIKIVEAGRYER